MPDDWIPKLTRIEDPIADDHWCYKTIKGREERVSRLMIGRPVALPKEDCWYTPVWIEGHLTKVTPIFGQGPVDSLLNAMTFVKRFHDEIWEVYSVGESPKVKRSRPSRVSKKKPQRKRQRPKG